MTAQADIAKHVRGWVEKAEHDRTNAVHTLTLETRCPFDTACYHAQQCAEKYLKAQLVLLGRDFPKTHDLGVLVALLPEAQRPAVGADELESLTEYVVIARYPGDWGALTRRDAERALFLAERVRDAARVHLPAEALADHSEGRTS